VYLGLSPSLVVHESPAPTAADGSATVILPIPTMPGLASTTLFGQWFVLDPLGPDGITSSDAFALTVF